MNKLQRTTMGLMAFILALFGTVMVASSASAASGQRVCSQTFYPTLPANTAIRVSVFKLPDGRYAAETALDTRGVPRVKQSILAVTLKRSDGKTVAGPLGIGLTSSGYLTSTTNFYKVGGGVIASSEGSYVEGVSGRIYPLNYSIECEIPPAS